MGTQAGEMFVPFMALRELVKHFFFSVKVQNNCTVVFSFAYMLSLFRTFAILLFS